MAEQTDFRCMFARRGVRRCNRLYSSGRWVASWSGKMWPSTSARWRRTTQSSCSPSALPSVRNLPVSATPQRSGTVWGAERPCGGDEEPELRLVSIPRLLRDAVQRQLLSAVPPRLRDVGLCRAQQSLALASAAHPRLGVGSVLHELPDDVARCVAAVGSSAGLRPPPETVDRFVRERTRHRHKRDF